jgi:hypothetical protein
VRNRLGALCGYVGVPSGHPLYGKAYGDIDGAFDVHGGLTFSNRCHGAICHVPEPGEPDDVWWFGFDCSHFGDLAPVETSFAKIIPGFPMRDRSLDRMLVYKDIAYVTAEVESLAEQIGAQHG